MHNRREVQAVRQMMQSLLRRRMRPTHLLVCEGRLNLEVDFGKEVAETRLKNFKGVGPGR